MLSSPDYAGLAQLVEHPTCNRKVVGSSPTASNYFIILFHAISPKIVRIPMRPNVVHKRLEFTQLAWEFLKSQVYFSTLAFSDMPVFAPQH